MHDQIVESKKKTGACTTIIVGKYVSTDGSRIFGRTEDSEDLDVKQIVCRPARSESFNFTDETNGFTIKLPEGGAQYLAVPNAPSSQEGLYEESVINQYGVSLTATESIFANEKALAADPLVPNGIAESSLPTVVIPYVKTAREGVQRLGEIVEQYGSAESNAVVFADAREMWYMEIYTGHQWAAVLYPDDCYSVIANDCLLDYIDGFGENEVMTSPQLISLAEKEGFLKKLDGRIHLALTYGNPHRDYSQIRVWAAQKRFSPSQTGEYNVNDIYAMFMKPDQKISLEDVMELTRYRYEDTKYDVNQHPHIRAIGINRTAEAHVFWLRDGKPEVMWVALANPEMSVYLPMYKNTVEFPEEFGVDCSDYDGSSAYYKIRSVSSLAVQDREKYGKPVRAQWKELERGWIADFEEYDRRYTEAGESDEAATAIFAEIGKAALDTADMLFQKTLTAFMLDTVQDGGSDAPADI